MKICYFGIYDSEYNRNKVLINGLKGNRVDVIECRSRLPGLAKYFDLIKKHWRIRKQYDVMVIGFPGYQAAILARFLTRKPIIFDAFASFYESMAEDRKIVKPKSLKALYYWILDWLSCKLADKILLDTNAHIDYFVKTFNIKLEKFHRIFVGADGEIFNSAARKTRREKPQEFTVHFHGSFIPLQGVEYIARAAKILENKGVKFNIVGKGQTYGKIIRLASKLKLNNICFCNPVSYEELAKWMAKADVCLGIFGGTEKAGRVAPNKVYEALAAGCPIITAETAAAKEILSDRKNALFCRRADADDLAEKILELKNNPGLLNKIAENGRELFLEKCAPKKLGKELKSVIISLISNAK